MTLRVGDRLTRAAVPASIPISIDQPAKFRWNLDKVHAFDAATGERLGP